MLPSTPANFSLERVGVDVLELFAVERDDGVGVVHQPRRPVVFLLVLVVDEQRIEEQHDALEGGVLVQRLVEFVARQVGDLEGVLALELLVQIGHQIGAQAAALDHEGHRLVGVVGRQRLDRDGRRGRQRQGGGGGEAAGAVAQMAEQGVTGVHGVSDRRGGGRDVVAALRALRWRLSDHIRCPAARPSPYAGLWTRRDGCAIGRGAGRRAGYNFRVHWRRRGAKLVHDKAFQRFPTTPRDRAASPR
ncbi:hypothetical protein [Rugamonas sp. DEMB1]|uniref:hypothetical protein n=1 Tax=Rugamonas sp. DEMB1 TaxID=3039386 RepID=UPI0024497E1C|nr:hypothetical protein [Rugamonas sp. DEMB1]WGG48692.1 hypothetical protein QC826_18740 [Rugamonas sp. DEMB1]